MRLKVMRDKGYPWYKKGYGKGYAWYKKGYGKGYSSAVSGAQCRCPVSRSVR